MPTKSALILSRLPSTFRPAAGPSALAAIAGALGAELQNAENTLASVMAAHWVGHADHGAEVIDDLGRLASLYGLQPRDDEDVEAFRRHLLRYVRAFLQGPSTVRGLVRVTAEALGLEIADDHRLIGWWTAASPVLTTSRARPEDAARLVLGADRATVVGQAEQPATVIGTVPLVGPIDLAPGSVLSIGVDGAPPVAVALGAGAAPTLDDVVAAVNAAIPVPAGATVAAAQGNRLVLRSPTRGAAGRMEIADVDRDAAPALLGLPPRRRTGRASTAAQVGGTVELGVLDLNRRRYLRVTVDRRLTAEIDCAGSSPAATRPDEVVAAINARLPGVARLNGARLLLTSQTLGAIGRIDVEPAAAQDAATLLLGVATAVSVGEDPVPARLIGAADLSAGVRLPAGSVLELSIDGAAPVTIDAAAADGRSRSAAEIVAAVNGAVPGLAVTDGRAVTLQSSTTGPGSSIAVGEPDGDAAAAILALPSRRAAGRDATTPSLGGTVDLGGGVGLLSAWFLSIALDHGTPVVVDLRSAAENRAAVTPAEIVRALHAALGPGTATIDGGRLRLTSTRSGPAGSVQVRPTTETVERAFVTRAPLVDEASMPILGFLRATAVGTQATRAVLAGTIDLTPGSDLRRSRFLRVEVDDRPPVDIDCAGPRPGVTVIGDVVARVNGALGAVDPPVASAVGGRLVLTSPTAGRGSSIVTSASRAGDASPQLFGTGPTSVPGQDATRVDVVGAVDLGAGIELPPGAALLLTVDGQTHEVALSGPVAAPTSVNEVAAALNAAFGARFARPESGRLRITSLRTGSEAEVSFAVPQAPSAVDATGLLLGFAAPRSYSGDPAAAAAMRAAVALPAALDLRTARFLRVAIDSVAPVDIDCAAGAADPTRVTPPEVVASLAAALGSAEVSLTAGRLAVRSATLGAASWVEVLPYTSVDDDARPLVLGSVPVIVRGSDAVPAVVTGEVIPPPELDLGTRSLLRIAVDGSEPVDADVAGPNPAATTPGQVVARLNEALPGVASLAPDGRLVLRSPVVGPDSRLEVRPPREIEVVDFPPLIRTRGPLAIRHSGAISVTNPSVLPEPLSLTVDARHGAAGPGLVRIDDGWTLRVLEVLAPGDKLSVSAQSRHAVRARIRSAAGVVREVPANSVWLGWSGARIQLPSADPVPLTGGGPGAPALLLDAASSSAALLLTSRVKGAVTVTAVEAALPARPSVPGPTDHPVVLLGRLPDEPRQLLDSTGQPMAHLVVGAGINLRAVAGRVVRVRGTLRPGSTNDPLPVLAASGVAEIFDVVLAGPDGAEESYPAVSIGADDAEPRALLTLAVLGVRPSGLVLARHLPRTPPSVPVGTSRWIYVECLAARFDAARFGAARFVGRPFSEVGIFDISRFTGPGQVRPVFAGDGAETPAVSVTLEHSEHVPGTTAVNLPADLPAAFGARFDSARFASAKAAESYQGAVLEPPDDPDYLPTLIAAGRGSVPSIVTLAAVTEVPQQAVTAVAPFRKPRRLVGGGPDAAATLYLREATMPGALLVSAVRPGEWGNDIEIAVRPSGPGRFDVSVAYAAAVYECARATALGDPPTVRGVRPAPVGGPTRSSGIGLAQARAAGIELTVARDRTQHTTVSDQS